MIPAQKPKKRKTWKRLLLGLMIIAALYAGYRYWVVASYEQELAALLEQIYAEDPNWTWEQRLEARNALKPEENGGIELVELLKLTTLRETMVPKSEWARKYFDLWQKNDMEYFDTFLDQNPNAQLPSQVRNLIEPVLNMEPMPGVLNRARSLKRYQEGRIDHTYRTLLMLSLLPDMQGTRAISNLLAYDADLLADRKQAGPAIESIQGMLGTARCLTHDPFMISLLVRCAIVNQACNKAARLLALPLPLISDQLKLLQDGFEQDQAQTQRLLIEVLSSERAVVDHDLEQLVQEKVSFSDIARSSGLRLKFSTGYAPLDQKLVNLFPEMLYGWGSRPGHFKQERVALLKFYTEGVRWSALPEHTLIPALETWKKTGPFLTLFLRQFHMWSVGNSYNAQPEIDSIEKLAHVYLRNRAILRAIIAAIACERYRLEKKSWPTSLEQLVPTYLKSAPIDPYTAQPLFLKALPDGLVIYSVGKDGKDDGGDVLPGEVPAKDLGYRLWNPAQRGINMDEKYKEYLKKMKQQ
ncbi:MAG TPA: hypothetical protein PLN21_15620 [Gemmatales bacterium]|nr:hypothetical protein [Gemmatales bacterium]